MKIAFYSYPAAFQNPGGGEVQLLKTKEALEKEGVEVRLFEQWNEKLDNFDILHIFGSVKDCLGLLQCAKNKKLKIVLSTIFWSSFKRAFYESRNPRTKADLTIRHLTKLIFPYFPSMRRKMMILSDVLLPNSAAEALQLEWLFAIPRAKIQVVPNGVDKDFECVSGDDFIRKHGLKSFVLAVGRIEPRKNQLNLIKAFRKIDRELVIVGDPVSDYMDYYNECKAASGKNVHFLGGIRHEDPFLALAYAACEVFVAPGWFETPGLASLEAGLAGTKLAVTKYGCTKEYFGSMADYFDPSNTGEIISAINSACAKERSLDLQKHILDNYTWDKVAKATISAYKRILGEKN